MKQCTVRKISNFSDISLFCPERDSNPRPLNYFIRKTAKIGRFRVQILERETFFHVWKITNFSYCATGIISAVLKLLFRLTISMLLTDLKLGGSTTKFTILQKMYFVLPLHWFSPSFCTENTVRFFSIFNDFHSEKILIFSPLWESFFYELGLSSRITNANWIHLVIYWATFTLCKLGCP